MIIVSASIFLPFAPAWEKGPGDEGLSGRNNDQGQNMKPAQGAPTMKTPSTAGRTLLILLPMLLALTAPTSCSPTPDTTPVILTIEAPRSRSVFQRNALQQATVTLAGSLEHGELVKFIQARYELTADPAHSGEWYDIAHDAASFQGKLIVPAGGWYTIEVRALDQYHQKISSPTQTPVTARVEKIGVGEVFITAGQSNSANHGLPALLPQHDTISAWTGTEWRHAYDPQPIATGSDGSPWSRLGDMLADRFQVPIGFISVGVSATRVANWLPGTANYERLQRAMAALAPNGLRAILWHQGESDTVDATPASTYTARLSTIIRQSRLDSGWNIPWGVALAAYMPSTTPEAKANIRSGQLAVINSVSGVFAGPDTDILGVEYRYDTVHFNDAGLASHALGWLTAIQQTFF
jgi:hypothetical protein